VTACPATYLPPLLVCKPGGLAFLPCPLVPCRGLPATAIIYNSVLAACEAVTQLPQPPTAPPRLPPTNPRRQSCRGLPATAIVYNSVLAACEAAAQLGPALDLLDEMRVAGVPRDQYTYSTLISCCYRVSC